MVFDVPFFFHRKFKEAIPLKNLRIFGRPGSALEGTTLCRMDWLPLGKVTKKEWDFIISHAVYENVDRLDNTS